MPFIFKKMFKKWGLTYDNVIAISENFGTAFKNSGFWWYYCLLTAFHILIAPLSLVLTLKVFSIQLPFIQTFAVYWFSFVIGRVSGLPGGFGSRDVAMGFLLVMNNIPLEDSVYIILLNRLAVVIPQLLIGLAMSYRLSRNKIFVEFLKEKTNTSL
jgi:uncharacterized protein (TIRG00374 family)